MITPGDTKPTSRGSAILPPWWRSFQVLLAISLVFVALGMVGLADKLTWLDEAFALLLLVVAFRVLHLKKVRWVAREAYVQRALLMLQQQSLTLDQSLADTLRTALANPDFTRSLPLLLNTAIWHINTHDPARGQWKIPVPAAWSDPMWSWCVLGLLSANPPSKIRVISTAVDRSHMQLDVHAPDNLIASIIAWERDLAVLLGVSTRQIIIKMDEALTQQIPGVPELELASQQPQAWSEDIYLEPEDITLTLSFDGKMYRAVTRKGNLQQVSEYATWVALWETWHHFDDADTALCRHIVT